MEAVYADESIWLTQKMMGVLYDVETHTINYHLKKVFTDSELEEASVIRKFRITAADGKSYHTQHYKLPAIIAVGYKVNSERAVQFRKWATGIIEQFTIKAFVMDDERIKAGGSVLTEQYFEEQLQRIREIRLSERKFYQKITDIFATAVDYDVTAQATKRFFATVQNKLHWAIHGQTAAEIVYHRADAEKANMGLTTWKDAPLGKIQKFDVVAAKNYLTGQEPASAAQGVRIDRRQPGFTTNRLPGGGETQDRAGAEGRQAVLSGDVGPSAEIRYSARTKELGRRSHRHYRHHPDPEETAGSGEGHQRGAGGNAARWYALPHHAPCLAFALRITGSGLLQLGGFQEMAEGGNRVLRPDQTRCAQRIRHLPDRHEVLLLMSIRALKKLTPPTTPCGERPLVSCHRGGTFECQYRATTC